MRSVILIYNTNDNYIYEILDDYHETNNPLRKDKIFRSFCKTIWSCQNKRRILKRVIKFDVRDDLLNTEIGQIFNTWSEIEYISYCSMTKKTDYANLIRQKVNNIYSRLFDSQICLNKEYMDLIKTPKTLYYKWLSGECLNASEIIETIDTAIEASINVKNQCSKQKMKLSWDDYKCQCEIYFRRMFDNFIPLDKFEVKNKISVYTDSWNEDNFCISYFCKGLDGYFKNYEKEMAGIKRNGKKKASEYLKRCKECGKLIKNTGNKKMYCDDCRNKKNKERYIKYNLKRTTNRKLC